MLEKALESESGTNQTNATKEEKMNYYDIIELELNTLKNHYQKLTLEIPRDESYADQIKRHQLQGKIAGIEYALKTIDTHRATINADIKENI